MGSGVRGIVGLGFSKCGRCPMKYRVSKGQRVQGFVFVSRGLDFIILGF